MDSKVKKEPTVVKQEPYKVVKEIEIWGNKVEINPNMIDYRKTKLIIPPGTIIKSFATEYLLKFDGDKCGLIGKQALSAKIKIPFSYTPEMINYNIWKENWKVANASNEIKEAIKNYDNTPSDEELKKLRTVDPSGFFYSYQIKFAQGGAALVSEGNTGNCQLSVLGCTDYLIHNATHPWKVMKAIARLSGRRMLLCDLKYNELPAFKRIVPKQCITMESPYQSTNGSSMTIILISTNKE